MEQKNEHLILEEAKAAFKKKDYARSHELLDQCLRSFLEFEVSCMKGIVFITEEKYEQGIKALQKVENVHGMWLEMMQQLLLAYAYDKSGSHGKMEKALLEFDKLASLFFVDPHTDDLDRFFKELTDSGYFIASANLWLKHLQSYEDLFDEEEIDEEEMLQMMLAWACRLKEMFIGSGQGRNQAACRDAALQFLSLIKGFDENAHVYDRLCFEAELKLIEGYKNSEETVRSLKSLLKKDPENYHINRRLALYYFEYQQDYQQALEHMDNCMAYCEAQDISMPEADEAFHEMVKEEAEDEYDD